MAGNRVQTLGTVFSRVRDLMRSGIINPSEKPLWYDVYAAFPPKREPVYVMPEDDKDVKREDPVPAILYIEDRIRAKFYSLYGTGPRAFDLSNPNFVSVCQRFVDKYTELESCGDLDRSILFEETAKALLVEGVVLKRRSGHLVSGVSYDPAVQLQPSDTEGEQEDSQVDISDSKVA
ncbi:28S ribosomal protein S23, mitochondrial [Thalassophryne amazonica]|uniref:28S ribosomal protein S23, mitochondrial n=1 Tax=Thalassophryne amazonica TaxID=390379 RepID=UPI0014718443|nr:28S ribosomal protein S23, mitochondrial [Thalassophryne amazonica]